MVRLFPPELLHLLFGLVEAEGVLDIFSGTSRHLLTDLLLLLVVLVTQSLRLLVDLGDLHMQVFFLVNFEVQVLLCRCHVSFTLFEEYE